MSLIVGSTILEDYERDKSPDFIGMAVNPSMKEDLRNEPEPELGVCKRKRKKFRKR